MIENNWWAEKYRPKTIEDFISNPEILDYVKDCIERDEIPHLLFHNEKSGSGKCLDFSELIDIEINLNKDEFNQLKEFLIEEL